MKHLNIFSKLIFFVVLLTSLFSCSPEKTYDTIEKPDFTSINETSKRKEAFIQYFLPIINEINNNILKDKKLLNHIAVSNNNNTLSEKQKQDLGKLEKKYNLNEGTLDNSQKIKELTLRINTIPVSMILAQAALESGWGTSRFSIEGNNFFGQHCFTAGCGIPAKNASPGTINEVTKFSSPKQSVKSYFMILNTGSKFNDFRMLRNKLDEQGVSINGKHLISTLGSYSELPKGEYDQRLKVTMDANNLYQYDRK